MMRSMAPVALCAGKPPMTSCPDAAASSATFMSPGVPEFLEDQHVGVFAQRRTGDRQHLVGAAAHLALADEAIRCARARR